MASFPAWGSGESDVPCRPMRPGKACAIAALGGLLLAPSRADAQRQRDMPLYPTKAGNFVMLDAIVLGAQASYENRTDLEEGMSKITTRASGLLSTPFAEASLNVDVNVFLWSFGASAGYQSVHHNHQGLKTRADGSQVPDNDANTLDARVESDKAFRAGDLPKGFSDTQAFPWAEGRIQLAIPMLEATEAPSFMPPLLFLNKVTARWEDRDAATFDWYNVTPHDEGVLLKYDGTLFYRNRDFGAIGPSVRYLNLPRGGSREHELHYGLTLVTSPGWQTSDIILFQLMFDFGNDKFGQHPYQELISESLPPAQILAVYRSIIEL